MNGVIMTGQRVPVRVGAKPAGATLWTLTQPVGPPVFTSTHAGQECPRCGGNVIRGQCIQCGAAW